MRETGGQSRCRNAVSHLTQLPVHILDKLLSRWAADGRPIIYNRLSIPEEGARGLRYVILTASKRIN